jgi:F-type H+-transporting ATPase subunit b
VYHLTQFAAETKGNIFASLGIDWQMLILQIVAFLILVWGLGKFVYPWLMKSVDERQDKIEAAAEAAAEAQKMAEKSEEAMEKLLETARKQATEIVNTARLESATALTASEERAKTTAERIVADAHVQIDKDIIAAKKSLYNETIDLVALATRKVVGKTVSAKQNDTLITEALKESK